MPERLGASLANAIVFRAFFCSMVGCPLGFDAGQLQVHRPGSRPILPASTRLPSYGRRLGRCPPPPATLLLFRPCQPRGPFPVTLSDPAVAIVAVAKTGHVELRQWNADQVFSLAADHLAMRNVLAQVLADLSPYDLPNRRCHVRISSEAWDVDSINGIGHIGPAGDSPR